MVWMIVYGAVWVVLAGALLGFMFEVGYRRARTDVGVFLSGRAQVQFDHVSKTGQRRRAIVGDEPERDSERRACALEEERSWRGGRELGTAADRVRVKPDEWFSWRWDRDPRRIDEAER